MHNAKIVAKEKYFKEKPRGMANMCKMMQVIVDRERQEAIKQNEAMEQKDVKYLFRGYARGNIPSSDIF